MIGRHTQIITEVAFDFMQNYATEAEMAEWVAEYAANSGLPVDEVNTRLNLALATV